MNLFDAQMLAKELISEHIPTYTLKWFNQKNVFGMCSYKEKAIYLSRPLTELCDRKTVHDTIMHEIAHALTPRAGHGRAWKIQMMRFGLSPDRVCKEEIDRSSISNWKATCQYCSKVSYMIRKPRVAKACGPCCGGKYDSKYDLTWHRI